MKTIELRNKFEEWKRIADEDTNELLMYLENEIQHVNDIKDWEESTNKELTEIEYFIKFL